MGALNRAQRVLVFLLEREGVWIDAIQFESLGGRQAWRTAISEARQAAKLLGKDIENRVIYDAIWNDRAGDDGAWMKIPRSQYRLVPMAEAAPTEAADLNAWVLR